MIFAAEITVATNADGDTATHYFSTHGFATKTADTPGKTHFAPRILDPGMFRREMSAGSRLVGDARSSFGELVLANADAALDAWLGYGVYGRSVVIRCSADGSGAYPAAWTTVVSCVMDSLHCTMREVRIRLRDRTIDMQRPICTGTFAGTGDDEGDASMAGRRKPRIYYEPIFPRGLLVDAAKNMYYFSETSSVDIGAVALVGGATLTMGADYTNLADCLANAPSSGQARIFYGPPVLVRYGDAPGGLTPMLTALSGLCLHDAVYPAAGNLFTEMGMTGVIVNGNPVVEGVFDDGATTWLDALRAYAGAGPFWFGFNRLGEFDWYEIDEPSAATSLATFYPYDVLFAERAAPADWSAPLWRVVVNYNQNYGYGATLASNAAFATYPGLSREYQNAADSDDATVLDKFPFAQEHTVNVPGSINGSTVSADWMALFGVERSLWTVRVKLTAARLALDINDTVTLQMSRYGLDAGKKFLIVAVQLNLRAETIEYTLWG